MRSWRICFCLTKRIGSNSWLLLAYKTLLEADSKEAMQHGQSLFEAKDTSRSNLRPTESNMEMLAKFVMSCNQHWAYSWHQRRICARTTVRLHTKMRRAAPTRFKSVFCKKQKETLNLLRTTSHQTLSNVREKISSEAGYDLVVATGQYYITRAGVTATGQEARHARSFQSRSTTQTRSSVRCWIRSSQGTLDFSQVQGKMESMSSYELFVSSCQRPLDGLGDTLPEHDAIRPTLTWYLRPHQMGRRTTDGQMAVTPRPGSDGQLSAGASARHLEQT